MGLTKEQNKLSSLILKPHNIQTLSIGMLDPIELDPPHLLQVSSLEDDENVGSNLTEFQ